MEVTINIDGQALSVEVTVEVYEYLDRADHKEENLAHEKRRHWDSREFDEYIVLTEGRSCYYQTPEQWVCRKETMLEIKAALALCTEAQRRRFLLYALEGLSYAEIAGLCCCSKAAIQDSIEAVRKRFLPETRHMVTVDILNSNSPVGFPGERYRFFLSDEGYKNARASENRGEIKIRNHAAVMAGKLYPDKKPPAQER